MLNVFYGIYETMKIKTAFKIVSQMKKLWVAFPLAVIALNGSALAASKDDRITAHYLDAETALTTAKECQRLYGGFGEYVTKFTPIQKTAKKDWSKVKGTPEEKLMDYKGRHNKRELRWILEIHEMDDTPLLTLLRNSYARVEITQMESIEKAERQKYCRRRLQAWSFKLR